MQENRFARVRTASCPALVFLLVFSLAIPGAQKAIAEDGDLMPKPTEGTADSNPPVQEQSSTRSTEEKSSVAETKKFKPRLIDTSIEEKPAVIQTPDEPEEKSEEYKEREARLSEPLKRLLQAPHIFDCSRGGSSDLSEAFVLAAKDGANARADLMFIVENGSPAGKIYAASLIRKFDTAAGNRILNDFKSANTLVKNKTYTAQEHYTLAEVATDLLSGAPTIILAR